MNASTAIGTIGTARSAYRGRFAPSPTGPLHLGSLLTAAGSYLQARAAGGTWLLRIEDLDTPRVVPGATDDILHTLERFGFEWDGEIVRQSARTDLYEAALANLQAAGSCFPCSCSRRELASQQLTAEEESFYPGTCRDGPRYPYRPLATRFRAADSPLAFEDKLQGHLVQNVAQSLGDFIIRRRDGLFAYQLAVVVDDAEQRITEVVRGSDLLSNTPRQILVQQALQMTRPEYMHLPLLTEPDGRKLSKSQRAVAANTHEPAATLHQVLSLLKQNPPAELAHVPMHEIWSWAIPAWDPMPLRAIQEIRLEAI